MKKDTFCSFCGTAFPDTSKYPRLCIECGITTYDNPRPVAVVLVPVGENGLLVTQRGNHMVGGGQWALPGGFIDIGEVWQTAGAREVWEECGVTVSAENLQHVATVSDPSGQFVLIFSRSEPVDSLPEFRPNLETIAIKTIHAPTELAFPLHTAAVAHFFTNTPIE